MTVKVCDAIMGSGKSSAAINYINAHPDKRFIYITPYLDEAARIRDACPELQFKEPSNHLPEFGFKKYKHTLELILAGENITSTHNMFVRYTEDMIDIIKERGYTLIIDEAVEVFRQASVKAQDIALLEKAGWLTYDGEIINVSPTFEYCDGFFKDIVFMSKGNRLVDMSRVTDCAKQENYYYWLFSKDIFEAFEEVYILTYLFDSQMMKYYFDISGIPHTKIGIRYDEHGYHFCDTPLYIPPYTEHLSEKIHIFDNDKLNDIGNSKHALSATWFKRSSDAVKRAKDKLRKNVSNFFTNYHRDKPASSRLWATYKNGEAAIRDKGFYRSNLAFNTKASNAYRHKNVLAYCVNIFMQPVERNYLANKGVDVREDEYALSVMIQWIWRSAIRDGNEVWIYIPSKRMRTLLQEWITKTEAEYRKYKENNIRDLETNREAS